MTTLRFVTPAPVAPSEVRLETTRERATPPTAGRSFREALGRSADAVLRGVEAAADLVPGGGAVGAAIRGARTGLTSGGQSAEGPSGASGSNGVDDWASMRSAMMEDNMSYLRIQEEMQAENRRFTTLSNVMKAEHETAKNSINNIR